MTYAHQNVELRAMPGLPPTPQHAPPPVADASLGGSQAAYQILLTRKGTQALVRVERLLDDASRAMPVQAAPAAGTLGALGGERRANTHNGGERTSRRP